MHLLDPARSRNQTDLPLLTNCPVIIPYLIILPLSLTEWRIVVYVPTSPNTFRYQQITVSDVNAFLTQYLEDPEEILITMFHMPRVISKDRMIDEEGREIGSMKTFKHPPGEGKKAVKSGKNIADSIEF